MPTNAAPPGVRRFPAWGARLLVMILLMGAATAGAEAQDLVVTGLRGINFGSLFRSSSGVIPYTSSSAAEFKITGQRSRRARITVSPTGLWLWFSAYMDIDVSNSHCAYSLNDGVTWTVFSTGTLFQDVTLPSSGSVRVRVGGSLRSSSSQRRGVYLGLITVNAAYR